MPCDSAAGGWQSLLARMKGHPFRSVAGGSGQRKGGRGFRLCGRRHLDEGAQRGSILRLRRAAGRLDGAARRGGRTQTKHRAELPPLKQPILLAGAARWSTYCRYAERGRQRCGGVRPMTAKYLHRSALTSTRQACHPSSPAAHQDSGATGGSGGAATRTLSACSVGRAALTT